MTLVPILLFEELIPRTLMLLQEVRQEKKHETTREREQHTLETDTDHERDALCSFLFPSLDNKKIQKCISRFANANPTAFDWQRANIPVLSAEQEVHPCLSLPLDVYFLSLLSLALSSVFLQLYPASSFSSLFLSLDLSPSPL